MEASIQTSFAIDGDALADTQFASAVLRQMGLPFVASESSEESIPIAHDIFSPSRANLFFVVDGVTGQELNLRDVEISASKKVRSTFAPSASPAALVASMLTGATPREHGIVADKWDYLGETEHAFIHAFPAVATISDVAAQYTLGKSKIVSASASPMFARALGLRPTLNSYADNSVSMQYDVQMGSTKVVSGNAFGAQQFDASDLKELLLTHFRSENLLDTPEHTALYAELAMILSSVSDLSVRAQTSTVADLYNFAITALNPIRSIHGVASSEYTSALSLVRRVISRAVEKVQHAYGKDKTLFEVLAVRTLPRSETLNDQIAAIAAVFDMDNEQVAEFYPHIYTSTPLPCAAIFSSSAAEAAVHCPTTFDERREKQINSAGSHLSIDRRAVFEENTYEETIPVWQMFMFTWIALSIITAVIVYTFFNMDIGEDSLLYRMTQIPTQSVE